MGIKVKMIESTYDNIKVTTPEDIIIAETIMRRNFLRKEY
jgi:2-C-methyl-D-erythritol 4-phosphate cytidylyltransferase